MKVLTFAAGLAAGYVLGTKAGRERYDQIVEGARKLIDSPPAVKAQATAKNLVEAGTDAVAAKLDTATAGGTGTRQPTGTTRRSPRRTPGTVAPEPQI